MLLSARNSLVEVASDRRFRGGNHRPVAAFFVTPPIDFVVEIELSTRRDDIVDGKKAKDLPWTASSIGSAKR
jgi:hypothetical protein